MSSSGPSSGQAAAWCSRHGTVSRALEMQRLGIQRLVLPSARIRSHKNRVTDFVSLKSLRRRSGAPYRLTVTGA